MERLSWRDDRDVECRFSVRLRLRRGAVMLRPLEATLRRAKGWRAADQRNSFSFRQRYGDGCRRVRSLGD
jgi:hypothetical protein